MNDEEFAVIRMELERLSRALTDAVRQIIYHEAEIVAMEWVLEKNGLMGELELAREEAIRQLNTPVDRTAAPAKEDVAPGRRRCRKWAR